MPARAAGTPFLGSAVRKERSSVLDLAQVTASWAKATAGTGLTTVSYTHLDVYKRQVDSTLQRFLIGHRLVADIGWDADAFDSEGARWKHLGTSVQRGLDFDRVG